jgi:prolyl-tRNA editing enzyme YbaK/EbsC (Cys-tRNA(Pro) deacylase)
VADAPRKVGSRERVRVFLETRGLADGLTEFEQPTKTAAQAAEAMACELGQIVKSLVVIAGDMPVLALVAGDRRGDLEAIAANAGTPQARMADAGAVRAATGYAIGGVSPFDLPEQLMVLVDDSLTRFDIVYPAAGTPSSMVRMRLADLMSVVGGRMARISH